VEAFLKLYYKALDEQEAAMKGKKNFTPLVRKDYAASVSHEEFQKIDRELKDREQTIVGIFLDAVNNHDGQTIIELANAVWFFKDKRLPNRIPADRERGTMIALKTLLDSAGQKIPIRTLAEFMAIEAKAAGKKFAIPEDGFSALRRKCKDMNFPLAESRKTSRK